MQLCLHFVFYTLTSDITIIWWNNLLQIEGRIWYILSSIDTTLKLQILY